MSPFMRNLHRIAVAVHLLGICLFAYLGMWFFAGWSLFFGGYSVWALCVDRVIGVKA